MSRKTLSAFRNFDGWLRYDISKNPIVKRVRTRQNFDDELWCFLDYVSEIKQVGINLIKEKGIRQYPLYKQVFNMFQGFARQAKNYYYAAKTLHYSSSSLLYYYAFLNLVKAYIILNEPSKILKRKIRHGLFYSKDSSKFSKQRIKVNNGVFPIFYKLDTWNSISNNTCLNIMNLLSYCREISLQYEAGGFGHCKIIPCYFSFVAQSTRPVSIRHYSRHTSR